MQKVRVTGWAYGWQFDFVTHRIISDAFAGMLKFISWSTGTWFQYYDHSK